MLSRLLKKLLKRIRNWMFEDEVVETPEVVAAPAKPVSKTEDGVIERIKKQKAADIEQEIRMRSLSAQTKPKPVKPPVERPYAVRPTPPVQPKPSRVPERQSVGRATRTQTTTVRETIVHQPVVQDDRFADGLLVGMAIESLSHPRQETVYVSGGGQSGGGGASSTWEEPVRQPDPEPYRAPEPVYRAPDPEPEPSRIYYSDPEPDPSPSWSDSSSSSSSLDD